MTFPTFFERFVDDAEFRGMLDVMYQVPDDSDDSDDSDDEKPVP